MKMVCMLCAYEHFLTVLFSMVYVQATNIMSNVR